ncbi:hypothetical protein KKI90_20170 [Xenorhabdus bovienii]|uniref:hypothetical protein n=1 Tax=Xenorhabdus bovienii TaxID=40576 RepID=UPI00237CB470|nr:hypothetical protein [Xenorhabdus bovienii]MDE1488608.1 hypothetical protein [Xenorhabdus bovienii]MDE9429510.1 hypothetical protein [Xenorhabdus bovienii]MDE9479452.1 hypothetical protein [Xenorhabdus bovienii]MDE9532283.1 hypothetical protein [Xenorhabdus bovienii]
MKVSYRVFSMAKMLGSVHHGADNIDFQVIANALDCHRYFYGVGIIYSIAVEKPASYISNGY